MKNRIACRQFLWQSCAVAFAQLQHQLEEWQRCFVEHQLLLLQHSEHVLSSSKREIIDKGWGIV